MQDEGLRIAWQYKKYFGDEKTSGGGHKGGHSLPLLIPHFFCCWRFLQNHASHANIILIFSMLIISCSLPCNQLIPEYYWSHPDADHYKQLDFVICIIILRKVYLLLRKS